MEQSAKKELRAVVVLAIGGYFVQVGETLFPYACKDRREAERIASRINTKLPKF